MTQQPSTIKLHYTEGQFDFIEAIMSYEAGTLPMREVIRLFQHMIDTGQVWQMQGSYGRTADQFIENGFCMLGTQRQTTPFGGPIPARTDVQDGTKGSLSYYMERFEACEGLIEAQDAVDEIMNEQHDEGEGYFEDDFDDEDDDEPLVPDFDDEGYTLGEDE